MEIIKPLILLLSLFLLSCSDSKNDMTSCNGLIDSVKIIVNQNLNTEQYYLVLRIRGLQDKTEILEIYKTKPDFDVCGNSQIQPITGSSVETKNFNNEPQLVDEVIFNTSKNTMEVKYALPSKMSGNKQVKLILK